MFGNVDRKQMSAPEQEFYKTLGERLRQLMREKKIRQLDVATEAGIASATLSNYLDGKRRLNMYKLTKILNAIPLTQEEKTAFVGEILASLEIDE